MRCAAIYPPEGEELRRADAVRAPTLPALVGDVLEKVTDGDRIEPVIVVAGAGLDPVGSGSGVPESELEAFLAVFQVPEALPALGDVALAPLARDRAELLPSMEQPFLVALPMSRPGDLVVVVDGHPGTLLSRRIAEAVREALPATIAALELRALRARLRSAEEAEALAWGALHALPDAVVVTYPSAETMHLNGEAVRLVGGRRDHARPDDGSSDDDGGNEATLTALVEDLWRRGPNERKVTLVDPEDARRVTMLATSRWVHDGYRSPSAIVTQLHDLSPEEQSRSLASELEKLNAHLATRVLAATREIAERNAQLERQAADLERASQLKSEFLAMVSHELRTPINAMLGYASLLERGVLGTLEGGQRDAIERMRVAAGRLTKMVNDTLDLARVEAGLVQLRESDIDIVAVLRDLSETARDDAAAKQLDYRLEIVADLPRVRSDETRVRQVLRHLLDNAVKFCEEGGITVRALPWADGDAVRIEVTDTGIGIPPEHLASIFEDFTRVDQSSTRPHGGAGLGLAICNKLIEMLDGKLGVASELGHGTTFRLTLPVHRENVVEAWAAAPARPALIQSAGGRRTVNANRSSSDPGTSMLSSDPIAPTSRSLANTPMLSEDRV